MKRRKKQLSPSKIIFIEFLLIVFFTAILCYVFLINLLNAYERQSSQNIDSRLDSVLVDMESKKSFPTALYDKSQILYVINAGDGGYMLARTNKERVVDVLWKQYESKNLYEMRKLKNGWIKYPQPRAMDFFESRRIIRYKYIPSLDWIVVLEENLNSKWDIIKSSIKLVTILQFLMFFLLEILLVVYSMNRFNRSLLDIKHESTSIDVDVDKEVNFTSQKNEVSEDGLPPDVLNELKEELLMENESEVDIKVNEPNSVSLEIEGEGDKATLDDIINEVKDQALPPADESGLEIENANDNSMTIIGQALSGEIKSPAEATKIDESNENPTKKSIQVDGEEDKANDVKENDVSVLDKMIQEMNGKD